MIGRRQEHLERIGAPRAAWSRAALAVRLLRWREAAPWGYDLWLGLLLGLVAAGVRQALFGDNPKLTYVPFFPFVALASLLGRPLMGAATIAVTALYVRVVLTYRDDPTPLTHLWAYALSAGIVIAIGDALMRALAAADGERRRAQAAETFYASLVRSSNDAIVTKTLDGIITGWNPAAEKILGYTAAEAIGRRIDLLYPPDRAAEEQAVLERILRGEAIEHFLTVRQAKSGALIDVSLTVSPIYDEAGRIAGVSKILRDVTKAKQDADALRDSEERLRCALLGARAGTWRWDVRAHRSDWSPRFCQMHGVDPETATPSFELWSARILADDREGAQCDLQAALAAPQSDYHSHYRVVTSAGEMRWVEVFGLIERDPDGSPRRISGISLDVTERHQVLNALTEANDNLRRANDSLSKFSSIAAHDLQEPLRKLEQFGDLLQQEYADKMQGDGAFYLRVMRDSARRMRALINALLNFSRAANRELTLAPVDMNDVMQHVLTACAGAIEESDALVEVERLPTIYGDADLVAQVFQNLISNAVKYAKPGQTPKIRVGASLAGPNASIHVRDEGIGIGQEHHEIIFEPFTRLNPREKVKGTGIGLAFCRTVCERHGWRLEVKSRLQEGAEFFIVAPRYLESRAA